MLLIELLQAYMWSMCICEGHVNVLQNGYKTSHVLCTASNGSCQIMFSRVGSKFDSTILEPCIVAYSQVCFVYTLCLHCA